MRLVRRARPEPDGRWVLVGLGNPGPRYEDTRHNAGALALGVLVERAGASFKRHKSGCMVAEARVGAAAAIFARPLSYMNESGTPVGSLLRWYRVPSEHLIVLHDELDIPFGDVRVKDGGGTAGHNGLGSIASHLGSRDFARVRIGIGRPGGGRDAADHVLDEFSRSERAGLGEVLATAADAAEVIVESGVERAMNQFNTRPRTPSE